MKLFKPRELCKRNVRAYWNAYEDGWNDLLQKLNIRDLIDENTYLHWHLEDGMFDFRDRCKCLICKINECVECPLYSKIKKEVSAR